MNTSILLTMAALGISTIAGIAQEPLRPGPGHEKPRVPPILAALDGNRDGRLDSFEIGNASSSLKRLDRNQDGEISGPELSFGGRDRGPVGRGDGRRDMGRVPSEFGRAADRINQPRREGPRFDDRMGARSPRNDARPPEGDRREKVGPRDEARRPSENNRGSDGPRDFERRPGDDRRGPDGPRDAYRPRGNDQRGPDGPRPEARPPRDGGRNFDGPRVEGRRPDGDNGRP